MGEELELEQVPLPFEITESDVPIKGYTRQSAWTSYLGSGYIAWATTTRDITLNIKSGNRIREKVVPKGQQLIIWYCKNRYDEKLYAHILGVGSHAYCIAEWGQGYREKHEIGADSLEELFCEAIERYGNYPKALGLTSTYLRQTT